MRLTAVRDLLGHGTVRMTERYTHLAPKNVRAAIALLTGNESRFSHVEETGNRTARDKFQICMVGNTGIEPVNPAV